MIRFLRQAWRATSDTLDSLAKVHGPRSEYLRPPIPLEVLSRPPDSAPAEGLRARVSRISILKGGEVSIVLRFAAIDRDAALQLERGAVVEVLTPAPAAEPPRDEAAPP
jgi:hypothetical protein